MLIMNLKHTVFYCFFIRYKQANNDFNNDTNIRPENIINHSIASILDHDLCNPCNSIYYSNQPLDLRKVQQEKPKQIANYANYSEKSLLSFDSFLEHRENCVEAFNAGVIFIGKRRKL
ncbi:hypothetical protein H312_01430 [Anncaliia algerae PRA339]|uniref:Uncharacterized protein n=1 Tax=Anncaliia algerae PRA339 TaxID=1288291 RepID=A0A059F1J2_9MICR|nr:hypothetical protein H312_01430 [Anncaliia algerae PRA339]